MAYKWGLLTTYKSWDDSPRSHIRWLGEKPSRVSETAAGGVRSGASKNTSFHTPEDPCILGFNQSEKYESNGIIPQGSG